MPKCSEQPVFQKRHGLASILTTTFAYAIQLRDMATTFVGDAGVSTLDQKRELQLYALKAIGLDTLLVERASGAKDVRPRWLAALRPDRFAEAR